MLYDYEAKDDRQARGECYIPEHTKLTRIEKEHILAGSHSNSAPIEDLSLCALFSVTGTVIGILFLTGAWHCAGGTGNLLTQFGWFTVCILLGTLVLFFGAMTLCLPLVILDAIRVKKARPQVRAYDNRDLAWKTLKKAIDKHSRFFAFRLAIKRQNELGQRVAEIANAYLDIIDDAVKIWHETNDERVLAKINELADQAAIAIQAVIRVDDAQRNHKFAPVETATDKGTQEYIEEGKRAEDEFLQQQATMLRELKVTNVLSLTDNLAAGKFGTTAT